MEKIEKGKKTLEKGKKTLEKAEEKLKMKAEKLQDKMNGESSRQGTNEGASEDPGVSEVNTEENDENLEKLFADAHALMGSLETTLRSIEELMKQPSERRNENSIQTDTDNVVSRLTNYVMGNLFERANVVNLTDGRNEVILSGGTNVVSLIGGTNEVSLIGGTNEVSLIGGTNEFSHIHGTNMVSHIPGTNLVSHTPGANMLSLTQGNINAGYVFSPSLDFLVLAVFLACLIVKMCLTALFGSLPRY
ncbi:uncharacterized protein LOC131956445 [Physella acuta]|uniref:uncharacterized protein LOC131956445 n=1 Tax=Physella acuta TaxID=109671 RepID=UPI0027DE7999|nr:uncharacterized protein LOC131956445 [Physella acuta]